MISKMNYLLLGTMMIAAIDSTFGSCCPCGKEEENINDQNNENNNKGDKIIDKNITKKTFTNSKINDDETGDLINSENLEYKNENIDNQNTRNNGKKNKKKKKKGKNTNGDGIKNENEKKESDKGVEELLLQNDFPQQTDNKIVGDNQEIKGIFENALNIFKQNPIHHCGSCNNQNNQRTIGFCAFNTHKTARRKYTGFSIRICPKKKCEVLRRCKYAPSVLLACGHVACSKCIELLCFCEQCKGYYCKNHKGCNNHTLCDHCYKNYICNNIPDTAHQDKCPSCANLK